MGSQRGPGFADARVSHLFTPSSTTRDVPVQPRGMHNLLTGYAFRGASPVPVMPARHSTAPCRDPSTGDKFDQTTCALGRLRCHGCPPGGKEHLIGFHRVTWAVLRSRLPLPATGLGGTGFMAKYCKTKTFAVKIWTDAGREGTPPRVCVDHITPTTGT